MKPPPFDYIAPDSVDDALDALHELGDRACVLAGGQSLIAMLNMRLLAPDVVIDISRLRELSQIAVNDGWLEIGAAVTQAELQAWPELSRSVPLLAHGLPYVGHFQTRARGTVCGSIAHADPSSELPLCLKTLEGEVVLRSHNGQRSVSADEFQQGMLTTARAPHELIAAVRFPLAAASEGYAFNEFTVRHADFALIATAACVTAKVVRLGVGGCADRPVAIAWPRADWATLETALEAFVSDLALDDDAHASIAYRRQLARSLGRRTIEEALACAD